MGFNGFFPDWQRDRTCAKCRGMEMPSAREEARVWQRLRLRAGFCGFRVYIGFRVQLLSNAARSSPPAHPKLETLHIFFVNSTIGA